MLIPLERGAREPVAKQIVQYLRRAIVAGFRDRSWIAMDKDLQTLRGEEEYKKIMADEGLFKEKRD